MRSTPWLGLAVVACGAAIAPLDFAVNVAFPAITSAFSLQTPEVRWVALCYVATYGSLMLFCGAWGDRVGHLRLFRWGLWLATVALTLCSFAPSYAWLLFGRVLQGVAVALTLSCAPALVLALYGPQQRTHALGLHGSMLAVAGMLAPLVGGLSMSAWGWPGVFGFRVPWVLLALAGVPLLARSLQHAASELPREAAPSGFLSPGSGLSRLQRVWRQSPDFAWVNIASVLVQFCSFSVVLILPYYTGPVRGYGSVGTGALLSVWAGGSWLGSAWAARLLGRLHPTSVLDLSILGAAAGLGLTGLWGSGVAWLWMALTLCVQGLSLGLFQVAYADQVVVSLPNSDRGVAGSLTWVTRTVGVLAGAVSWLWLLDLLQTPAQGAAVTAMQVSASAVMGVMQCASAVLGVFALVSWVRHRR